jgi:putative phage-type endonuclease
MDRDKWLADRHKGIGGSEAASVVDMNPWKSRKELLKEKIEMTLTDIKDNDRMKYGRDMEGVLVDAYDVKTLKKRLVTHNTTYGVYTNDRHPFIRYTPDATYMIDKDATVKDARFGFLECKTTTISKHNPLSKWVNSIPDHYMIQVLHGFLANLKWNEASTIAEITRNDESGIYSEIRVGHYVREDVAKPLADLLQAEIEFWMEVEDGRKKNN